MQAIATLLRIASATLQRFSSHTAPDLQLALKTIRPEAIRAIVRYSGDIFGARFDKY